VLTAIPVLGIPILVTMVKQAVAIGIMIILDTEIT
jgi:hypothetical protein